MHIDLSSTTAPDASQEGSVSPREAADERCLYNISIVKAYLGYIQRYHPDADIDAILRHAGIERHQLNDSGFWFTQEQSDRFYEASVATTGNPSLARKAAHFGLLSGQYATFFEYIAGFVTPASICEAAEKISNKWTRGTHMSTRKLGHNRVEVTSVPAPGVQEKPYQCENRLGVLESLGKAFTGNFARIDHTECIHQGGTCCRYVMEWDVSPSFRWLQARNYLAVGSAVLLVALYFVLPLPFLIAAALGLGCMLLGCSWYAARLEQAALSTQIEDRGQTAEMLLEEIKSRYNDALLVQEIGQASSHILEIDALLGVTVQILKKRLEFDRGAVLLANPEGSRLTFRVGFGYSDEDEAKVSPISFDLEQPTNQGPLVVAFKKQTPYLVNNIEEILSSLSPQNQEFLRSLGARAFICVPIIFEKKSLGILFVERTTSPKPMNQSEVSLLVGIAQQIAVSISNARSFQKLQASEERYRELVQSANSIILRLNTQGYITFFNEFAQKFFDYTEHEILGKHAQETILLGNATTPIDFARWLRGIGKEPGKYMNTQTEGRLKDSRRIWIAWTNRPIFDEQGNLSEILCIGNDITKLKVVQEEKRKLEHELQRAQKMEAIGTLAGGVAHDLNNILSSLVSYPDLLLMKIPEDSPLVRPLTTIRKSGEKASAIVQDLLTLARRGVSVSQVVNMNAVITDYLGSSEFEGLRAYHPHIKMETILDKDLLNTLGSEVHLSKTIMNMVSNAAEAMPKGGLLRIMTRNIYCDTPLSGYDHIVEGEYVMVTVADEGIGISSDDLPRIFEPFYSKKVMGRSGTGLGMAVIWSTVKDHHGYIDVHSEVGKGTTIDIYLPVTRKALSQKDTTPTLDSMRGTETILVVDDIPEQREIASEILSTLGYTVTCVTCGEEALEHLKHQDCALLILDMIMDPGIDGLETYRRILALKPAQKAIIVSGYSETDKVKAALKLGARAYVKKPYTLDKIGKVVREALDKDKKD